MNFMEVLCRRWTECKYKIIFAVFGEKTNCQYENYIFCEKAKNLPDCIKEIKNMYASEFYMIFLGDAFFTKKVEDKQVRDLLSNLKKDNIQYCSLIPKKSREKIVKSKGGYRFINYKDRYSHSFIAFIVTGKYLDSEFKNGESDDDFETKYLLNALNNENIDKYYKNDVVLTEDLFGILPGITKGKWDRVSYWKLRRLYPDIEFAYREKITVKLQIIIQLRKLIIAFLPNDIRKQMKRFLSKFVEKKTFDLDV